MIADGHFGVPTQVNEPVRQVAPGDAIGRPDATLWRPLTLRGHEHQSPT